MSNHTLLRAVLEETADLTSRDHWKLREKLARLRRLAVTIRDTDDMLAAVHPSGGISSFEGLRGDDDTPNHHLAAVDSVED